MTTLNELKAEKPSSNTEIVTENSFNQTFPVIRLENVLVAYGREVALFDVSLDVFMGEFIGICGPNASGKTTLLKTMLGVVKPFQGRVLLFGKELGKKGISQDDRFRIGYVPQILNIDRRFPALVEDVILMGRYGRIGLLKPPGKKDKQLVRDAAEKVDLETILKRPIGHLSGGQQQKVLIAQILAQNPEVLIMDEPTSALDFKMARSVMETLKDLNQNYGLTIITINHNIRILREFSQRIICLNRKVHFDGDPNAPTLEQAIERTFFA